ncbi:unnamed protein product [Heligmosomoides polygyrus]|uniref:DUF3480 domain-containing protein n=1 Tax=Heligmosomoides polygyrus TaxID=6339 RepID=A0A183GVW6_HELPZ|nr:unnamed protein product [Heligmosomoides polygyrus]
MEVVREARATILIGGTMEPANLLVDCLTRGGAKNGIRRFTCSHVIDDHQLLALSIGHHVRNEAFSLTFETRGNVQCVSYLWAGVPLSRLDYCSWLLRVSKDECSGRDCYLVTANQISVVPK